MSSPKAPSPRSGEKNMEEIVIGKLDRKVLAFCCGIIFLLIFDRSNISFAAHDLCSYFEFKHEDYALGVALFYVAYLVLQLPINQLIKRFGAAGVLGNLMFLWGCIALAFSFAESRNLFYSLRFFAGLVAGGFFPGVLFYAGMYYPDRHVGLATLGIIAAYHFTAPISAPISSGILKLDGQLGLEGWRWLFLVQGAASVAFSVVLYLNLERSPETARFLEPEEKQWIEENHGQDRGGRQMSFVESLKTVVSKVKWWLVVISLFGSIGTETTVAYWITLIVRDDLYGSDEDDESCGAGEGSSLVTILLTAIPFTLQGLAPLIVRRFDVKNPARTAALLKISSGAVLLSWIGTRNLGFVFGFASICVSTFLNGPTNALTLTVALSYFDRSLGSVVASLTNVALSFGLFVVPFVTGILLDASGYRLAMAFAGSLLVAAGVILLFVPDPSLKTEAHSPLLAPEEEVI